MKTPFKVFSREDVFHSLFPFLSLLKSLIPSSLFPHVLLSSLFTPFLY